MQEFARAPNKAERLAARVLALLLTAVFGGLAYFLWISRGEGLLAALLAGLAVACLCMFFSISRTRHRALTESETNKAAWLFFVLGAAGIVFALIMPGAPNHRLMVLGGSITFFGAGFARLRRLW